MNNIKSEVWKEFNGIALEILINTLAQARIRIAELEKQVSELTSKEKSEEEAKKE